MPIVREPELARRLARVLFSDLVAYAGDEIRLGIEKDDLFDRLGADIEQARVFFSQHVGPEVADAEKIFAHALVDVLIGGQRRVHSHIW